MKLLSSILVAIGCVIGMFYLFIWTVLDIGSFHPETVIWPYLIRQFFFAAPLVLLFVINIKKIIKYVKK